MTSRSVWCGLTVLPTHDDLAVIVAASFSIQLGAPAVIIVTSWRGLRPVNASLAESQRLTRAVGALVIQETDKPKDSRRIGVGFRQNPLAGVKPEHEPPRVCLSTIGYA